MKGPLRSFLKFGLWDKNLSRCFMLLRFTCISLRAKILNKVPKFVLLRQKSLFAEVSLALQPAITHQHEVHKVSPGNGCSTADTGRRSCVMNPTRIEPKSRNQNFKQVVFFFASCYLHEACEPFRLTSKVVEESLQIREHRKTLLRRSY